MSLTYKTFLKIHTLKVLLVLSF